MNKYNNISTVAIPVIGFLCVLFLWNLLPQILSIPSYILPTPIEVVKSFYGITDVLFENVKTTFTEALLGFLLGSVVGFFVGVVMAENTFFAKLSLPFLIASNAVPIVALAPVILLWMGNTILAKIVVSAFISFFPIVLNTYRGLNEFPKSFQSLFMIYGASDMEFLLKFKLRNATPYIITGLKLNATLSVIGAIVAEFVSPERGIGYGIIQANYGFNSARLWGYIFCACSIGIFLYFTVYSIEKFLTSKNII